MQRQSIWRSVAPLISLVIGASVFAQGDPLVIQKIIDSGRTNQESVRRLQYLTQEIGPRLTASPNLDRSLRWAKQEMEKIGLQNIRLEKWGEYPMGWERGRNTIGRMVAPHRMDFNYTWPAWTEGTNGLVRGPVIITPRNDEEFEGMKGRLKGAWILMPSRPDDPSYTRWEASDLDNKVTEAGIAGRIWGSPDEYVRTHGNFRVDPNNLPKGTRVLVRKNDFDALWVAANAGRNPVAEFDLPYRWVKGPIENFNLVGEIPGTTKADEFVVLCAHIDSWDGPGSQGAADNALGSIVALEAAKLILQSGARPERTIRVALWTGEEQGLFGSIGYTEKHRDQIDKHFAVLNEDSGPNPYFAMPGTAEMKPIIEQAIAPLATAFPGMPVTFRVVQDLGRGGSDHAPFNWVGVPGFQLQKRGSHNYRRIWHTQYDRFEEVDPVAMNQMITTLAVIAYNFSMQPEWLPRVRTGRPGAQNR
ncbi:MAG: M28 family metallopeptidase [Fimbriimonadaceae bacterium]